MKKKFFLFMALMVALTAVLAGCRGGEGADGEEKLKIGVALPDFDDKWLSYLQDGMTDYEKKAGDIEGVYVDAMNDAAKQMSQVETFISQGVDAIAIVPVDTESVGTIVDMANAAEIPIVVVNRTYKDIEDATAFVGGNSIDSGIMQMEEVAKLLGGKGNIAIMNGIPGHEAEIKRTEGNKQIIDKNPGMKVVLEKNADFDRAKGMTLMENWLQSGKKIDAVVANNDEMAIGAIMALEAAGKLEEVTVAGIDGTPDALEYVKSGKLKVSVFQDAAGQGSKGLEIAAKAAKGEEVEKMNYIPFELITPENVETFEKKWQ
ncbi:sugar ABC transporter substrate-binding protein [Domibacillus sp. DTU_2020_1001157_1_SI_ALB_TIR_016]|uniref:sugar ABC transporter substrate-binding protein n=1 Tax=Domibacillus sp. DTU_2020_1001157_1_SI_ALB_TIR_016 TaxID=3077789 RepID=UPI0028EFCBD8|nr:sugar ABC transporter substrate-binding protein [Domibacillus sp. DTU_2020_1001157_1_SI_ALB_TIR_016]WNS81407.1 sugar ABC transporter substrate-binding protein [Domibacillus sp. DTU_2020_1001157_1_SI_ALB_TIR_016]